MKIIRVLWDMLLQEELYSRGIGIKRQETAEDLEYTFQISCKYEAFVI